MVTLVTGAAKGLGSQFASWMAERGSDVIIHYNKSEKQASLLKKALEKDFGITCYIWQADFSEGVQDKLNYFLKENKLEIDVLINNVGNFIYEDIDNITTEQLQDVMNSNFTASFALCNYCIPLMMERSQGYVINLTCSGAEGLVFRQKTAFYHYAKSGVYLLTQMWAQKLAQTSVTINSISPGVLPESVYKDTISKKFWTTYDEVAQALSYLLDSPTSVNGVTIDLAKGWKPGCGNKE